MSANYGCPEEHDVILAVGDRPYCSTCGVWVLDHHPFPEDQIPRHLRPLGALDADGTLDLEGSAVVPGVAYRGRVSLLAAREKLGKSTFAGAAASAASLGREFLGSEVPLSTVLWLGLEEHDAEIWERFRRFGADPARVLLLSRLFDPVRDLQQAVAFAEPDLVVIDTLAALASGRISDASASAAWTPLLAGILQVIRDSNAAGLLIHHARKTDGTYRDSSAIGAGVDVIAEMHPDGDLTTRRRRFRVKARLPLHDFGVQLVGDRFELLDEPRALPQAIAEHVRTNPGCTQRSLRDGVPGKAARIAEEVHRLIHSGRIENRGTDSHWELWVSG